jgi:glycerophosphoryl diester phosphodiesterase
MLTTINFDKKNAKMVAHRGLSSFETENTVAAFIAAGNHSYWGIETDVHKTKDGKFIITHDDNMKRISGDDYIVEETDFDTLRNCKLYAVKSGVQDGDATVLSDKKRADLVPPTLEEYIGICKKYSKFAVLEIKNLMEREDVEKIIDIIGEIGYLDKTVFISFSIDNLVFVKEKNADLVCQFLTYKQEVLDEKMPTVIKYNMDLDLFYGLIDKELVEKTHARGAKINAWTPGNPKEGERLASIGVDYITSNFLE